MIDKEKLETLVSDAQQGNIDSYGEIYDIMLTPIYNFIYYKVSDRETAEDLTGEIFLKVWDNIQKYKKENTIPFSAWIYTIARNHLTDHYRKNANHNNTELDYEIADEHAFDDILSTISNTVNQELLENAMKQLNDDQREILVLKYINDLNNKEIAHITAKPEGTIRQLHSRALKNLKGKLQEYICPQE